MVLVLVALIVAGCSPSVNPVAKATPTPSHTTLKWTDCGGGFQCTTVQVPMDYAHPDAGSIGIAVSRKPATDTARRIGSVLTNPGGPGASGIQFLRGEAASMSNLNTRLDLIGFDPRGVGQSAPVRCLDGPQEDAFNALDPVFDDPCRLFPTPGAIMPGVALLARLLFPSLRLLHSGFHKCRRGRLLLFQFFDALVSLCQLLVRLVQLYLGQPQLLEYLTQLGF